MRVLKTVGRLSWYEEVEDVENGVGNTEVGSGVADGNEAHVDAERHSEDSEDRQPDEANGCAGCRGL